MSELGPKPTMKSIREEESYVNENELEDCRMEMKRLVRVRGAGLSKAELIALHDEQEMILWKLKKKQEANNALLFESTLADWLAIKDGLQLEKSSDQVSDKDTILLGKTHTLVVEVITLSGVFISKLNLLFADSSSNSRAIAGLKKILNREFRSKVTGENMTNPLDQGNLYAIYERLLEEFKYFKLSNYVEFSERKTRTLVNLNGKTQEEINALHHSFMREDEIRGYDQLTPDLMNILTYMRTVPDDVVRERLTKWLANLMEKVDRLRGSDRIAAMNKMQLYNRMLAEGVRMTMFTQPFKSITAKARVIKGYSAEEANAADGSTGPKGGPSGNVKGKGATPARSSTPPNKSVPVASSGGMKSKFPVSAGQQAYFDAILHWHTNASLPTSGMFVSKSGPWAYAKPVTVADNVNICMNKCAPSYRYTATTVVCAACADAKVTKTRSVHTPQCFIVACNKCGLYGHIASYCLQV
jgi:hypothetical protein